MRIYGVSELWDSITAESAINSATEEEVSSVATLKDSFIISVKSGRVSNVAYDASTFVNYNLDYY